MKDTPQQVLPNASYWSTLFSAGTDHSDRDGDRDDWNRKSVNFVQKNRAEDYVDYLIERMALAPGDVVFDMGCGAGTLAIPLAQRGHRVIAVDFSDGMLEGLCSYAEERGVSGLVEAHRRAWQDDLSDLPCADVAISSRSLIVSDLSDALAKLESKARKRCVVTLPGGERRRYEEDLGLVPANEPGCDYRAKTTLIVSAYLFALGRMPKIDYITYPHSAHGQSAEALVERTLKFAKYPHPEDNERIRAWLLAHIVPDEANGGVRLDVEERGRWTYVEWDVPAR